MDLDNYGIGSVRNKTQNDAPALARFDGLLDEDPAGAEAPTVWTGPRGHRVPISDSVDGDLASYVVGNGPVSRAMRAAGLHHPVVMEPLTAASGREVKGLEDWSAIVNPMTGMMVGLPVRSSYQVAQHATVAAMLDNVVADDAEITIVSYRNGERLVFECELQIPKDPEELPEKLKNKIRKTRDLFNRQFHGWTDKVSLVPPTRYSLLVSNGLGYMSTLCSKTIARVLVCDNGLVQDFTSRGFNFKHSSGLNDRLMQAQAAMQLAQAESLMTQDLLSALFLTPMTQRQWEGLLEELFPLVPTASQRKRTRVENRRKRMTELYHDAPGAVPGKAYGALQAITFWNTHEANIKGFKDAAPELAKAHRYELLTFGRGERLASKTLQYCYNLAVN